MPYCVLECRLKKILKIAGRVAMGVLLTVYVAVAALNYSVVQSYLGMAVGEYFSREWGGQVKIGSLHATPWDHLIADNLLMVDPYGDTILDAKRLSVRFRRFPFKGGDIDDGGINTGTLTMDRVYLRDAYYHLAITEDSVTGRDEINLQHIIDYFNDGRKDKDDDSTRHTFTIDVNTLVLNRVHYRMDLPEFGKTKPEHGVDIPHMEFFDINARFKDLHVVNEDVTVRILKMSTLEKSGFKVDNISGEVHVGRHDITVKNLDVETPRSHIMADARMDYPNWMPNYLQTVQHELLLKEGTTVNFSDIAYWAPVLWGIDAQLRADGTASGTIDNLVTEGLNVYYGGATEVVVAGTVKGLPDIENTVFNIDHLGLKTEESDLRRLSAGLPQLPERLVKQLCKGEYLDLHARGEGGLHGKATANINMVCGFGNLQADILTTTHTNGRRRVTLDANSDGMGLAWIGTDWLTHAGMTLSVDAELPRRLDDLRHTTVNAELSIPSSTVKGNRLSPIDMACYMNNGVATLKATSNDSLAAFDAEASVDLRDSLRNYTAAVVVDRLAAHAFGLLPEPQDLIKGRVDVKAQGNDIDDMDMELIATNVTVGDFDLKDLVLNVASDGRHKDIRLESTPLSASAYGDFAYSDLPLMVQQTLSTVLPADLGLARAPDSTKLSAIAGNTVNFSALWLDDGEALQTLVPGMRLAYGSRLSGTYNNGETLKMVVRIDSLRMGSLLLSGLGLSSHRVGGDYVVDIESQDLSLGSLDLMSDIGLVVRSNSQRAEAGLVWGDSADATHGDLLLSLRQGRIEVVRPFFHVGSTPWMLDIADLVIDPAHRMSVKGSGISIHSDSQRISADISMDHQDNDYVMLDFDRFNLELLCDMLLQGSAISVAGLVDGHFELYGLGQTPYFNTNLTIDSCHVNRQSLGDVAVKSNWNAELNTLNLQLHSPQLDATGWIGLADNDPGLNFDVAFDSFDLSLAAPLMKDFSNRFEGMLHGSFDLGGTLGSPVILGEALVENGALHVDMTGVTYYFNDSLRFNGNTVSLDRFLILDSRGNTAYLDGEIHHHSLRDLVLDLDLSTDNLLVLDRPDGDQFFGTLLASATGKVTGRLDNLKIAVDARTNPGSTLSIPVSEQRQVKSQSYITFVDDQPEKAKTNTESRKSNNHLNLEVDLDIRPDMRLALPMVFSGVDVNVGASGSGNLHLSLSDGQQPQVLGSYEITSGTMKLTLVSLVVKDFTIEQGSNLSFQGSVPDARFDLRAVYSQRANLSTLTGSLSTLDNTQKYIQVENVIAVSGTLTQPTIGFDLRLPNADQSVEDEVFSYIDRNSERDMLNQTVSLLVNGNFYNVSGNDLATGGNAATSGISTLASTLGGMMADMVDIVDINVDYRAATDMTNQQLDLNISKDWGRWYLESTLGYGGESRELEASNTGGTVIDALVGYRLSPLVHLYAYNRTNTNDYTRMDLPYKQGIGLKLTKDFDRWSDLFRPAKKKTKKKK